MDLINDISTRVFPIGRLDIDTEGLLLLTNDGELAYKLTHPRHQIPKTYVVTVHGQVDDDKINALQTGVELSDGSIVKGEVKSVQRGADDTTITMIIYEGKNRQIRRMILTIGHRVKHLKRSQLSFLTLEGIPTGKYRLLNQDEYHRLTELD
jgi:pseudouridine synthase